MVRYFVPGNATERPRARGDPSVGDSVEHHQCRHSVRQKLRYEPQVQESAAERADQTRHQRFAGQDR